MRRTIEQFTNECQHEASTRAELAGWIISVEPVPGNAEREWVVNAMPPDGTSGAPSQDALALTWESIRMSTGASAPKDVVDGLIHMLRSPVSRGENSG